MEKSQEKFKNFKSSRLYEFFYNNRYVVLSFLCSAAVMIVVYLSYGIIPFGEHTVLRMDLYHQYGPLFAELYDRLTGFDSLIYSWTTGGGGSFLGAFYNYLSSPLSIFILAFGHIGNPESISFLILIKAALASAAFTYYLKKSDEFSKHNATTAAFGVLYAFCGFFIAYYWNVMWLDAMYMLPLVVLGIERIINKGKPMLYSISLAITLFANFYLGFMVCIFCLLYAVMYYFGKYSIKSKFVPLENGQKQNVISALKNSRLLTSVFKFIGSSFLAILLCAVSLLPVFYILQFSSATSGNFPQEMSSYFKIFDFLANHLASLDPTIRSSGDDVLPNIYSGILTVMLVVIYAFIKSIPTREKISRVIILAFMYFSFNTNYLNYIWHGFHFPNDLPYRSSFMYTFLLLVIAYKALLRVRTISSKDILTVSIAVIMFIVIADKVGSKNVFEDTVLVSIVFVIIYTFVLSLLNNRKYQAKAVAVLLLCCVLTEIIVANTNHYVMDQQKPNYTCDYEDFKKLESKLQKHDGSSFYRMELTNLNMRMDPSWFGYNGLSTFSSMASEPLSNLQYYMGMFGNFINSYTYNLQTPVYNSMFALKYVVDNDNFSLNPEFYTQLMSVGKYTAYEYNYHLPIAFFANSNLYDWVYDTNNPFANQNSFMENASGISDVLNEIPVDHVTYNNVAEFDSTETTNFSFSKVNDDLQASFDLNYKAEKRQNIYIYFKSDDVEADTITINVNGEQITDQYVYEEYILDIGVWDEGTMISVDIPVKENLSSGFADCFAAAIDMEKFEQAYDTLNKGAIDVSDFKETYIKGTMTAPSDGYVYTSITYDKGWHVFIDGEELDESFISPLANSLLAFNIHQGKHIVEFKYEAPGLVVGATVSAVTVIGLIIAAIVMNRKRNTVSAFDNDTDATDEQA